MAKEERLTEEDAREAPRSRRRQSASQAHVEPDAARTEGRDTMDAQDMTDDERFAMFEDTINQSVLPKLPEDSEYHFCWLSTTNPRDTILNRKRMGYQLVSIDMVQGWESDAASISSAAYPGVISANEMVLGRLPARLYQRYMVELHHTRPLGEEEKLKNANEAMKQQAEEMGGRLVEGDGMSELVQRAEVPRFAV